MVLTEEEFEDVVRESHAVIAEARAAQVYVFGGASTEGVAPSLVHPDGTTTSQTTQLDGGFCVIRVESREDAEGWAAKFASACRTPQELRQFGYDPDSWTLGVTAQRHEGHAAPF
jgi:hypothetical protein